jgi:hypothetical protein
MEKKWWTSKTLWVNAISVIAIIAQGISGREIIPLETQGSVLGGINIALRMITKSPVVWK